MCGYEERKNERFGSVVQVCVATTFQLEKLLLVFVFDPARNFRYDFKNSRRYD